MKSVAVIVLLAAAILPCRADTLILTSGEILTGEIIAESATDYRVRIANANFTITTTRVLPKTDVKSVTRDTPEQKAHRVAYENLCRYNLNPNQEFFATYYSQVIALMEKFLATYPDDAAIRTKLADWTTELAQLNKGLVKYNNRWLPSTEKAAAVKLALEQARLQTARKNTEKLQQRLTDLQAQQQDLNKNIETVTSDLDNAEAALANLQDFVDPTYEYRPIGGAPFALSSRYGPVIWSPPFWERYIVGERVTRHPQRTYYEQKAAASRNRLARLQTDLEQTIRDIRTTRADLDKAQDAMSPTPSPSRNRP